MSVIVRPDEISDQSDLIKRHFPATTSPSGFETSVFFSIKQMPAGGIWNISHPELNRSYFNKFVKAVGKGDPGAINMPLTYMENFYGMSWYDMRRIFTQLVLSTRRDKELKNKIRIRIGPFVAVRTGKLLDFIMKTMHLSRSSWGNYNYWTWFTYGWPADRPWIIQNPQHSPPETGYGYLKGYKLSFESLIPNITKLYDTPEGALYLLNDPLSRMNVHDMIGRIAADEILDDYIQLFEDMIVTVML